MHDGRFETLEEVVDHYSTGIQNHDNLSEELKNADQTPAHVCQHLRQQPAAESSAKRSDYSRLIEEVSPSTLSTLSTLFTLSTL